MAQDTAGAESAAGNENSSDVSTATAIKRVRYNGTLLLIHLPTGTARALVMPEPVTLLEDAARLPGVKLAYEGNVIGFFATRDFTRRIVSFVGTNSGNEYNMQIRATENGIAEPLEIVR